MRGHPTSLGDDGAEPETGPEIRQSFRASLHVGLQSPYETHNRWRRSQCVVMRHRLAVATAVWTGSGSRIMTIIADDIYRSSNGDCWKLVRDTSTGQVVVR